MERRAEQRGVRGSFDLVSSPNLRPATRNPRPMGKFLPFSALLLILLASTVSMSGSAQFLPFVETLPEGKIDWDNGFFYGTGQGYPHLNGGSRARALKVAQAKALSAILQVASGLRVDDRRTLGELEKEKAVIQIRALVRYEPFREEYVEDSRNSFYRVTYKAPMKGVMGLTRQIIPHLRSRPPAGATPDPGGTVSMPEEETWLVLDGRGLGRGALQPALFPVIVNDKGEILSDINTVEEHALVQQGMARYVVTDKSREEIMAGLHAKGPEGLARLFGPSSAMAQEKSERKRQARYIVKDVTQVQGLRRTNLVISEADAKDLKEEDGSSQILRKCRVIVVVSSSAGGIEGTLPVHLARQR